MKASIKSSAPWLAAGVTVLLCIGFWLPLGQERLGGTAYQRFDKLLVRFMDVGASSAPASGPSPVAGRPAAADSAAPASVERPSHARHTPKRRRVAVSAPTRPSAPEPTVIVSSAASPVEGIPQAAPPTPETDAPLESYSADLIREAFEAEPSKLRLDAKVSADKVILTVAGVCRWQGRYIVRVLVTNQGGSDFFIKELAAYAGPSFITAKSYFRLFVEPGRTRDGHVVFDPASGAKVKITLKEDRENGRVIEVPVPYPF